VTDSYYKEYWEKVEELGLPVVWHVNDPEEFWDPDKLPSWAKERNWGYGPSDVQKEQLYEEVEEILNRHTKLKIIFAHFYFLSADVPRMKRFLDRHKSVSIDLTPGIEMLYNLSKNTEMSRDFFIKYADRIIYGTDISSNLSLIEGSIRAGIVFRWLESDHVFRVPQQADFLLGKPEDGTIKGMQLPDRVLRKIYFENITSLTGRVPQPLNLPRCIAYCDFLSHTAHYLSGIPVEQTEAHIVSQKLKTLLEQS
jgi:predicted TIM-barrel fold metal-dependent hydrolase